MVNSSQRTFGEALNTWVQTVAIVLAGLWAVYVFIYQQITLPRSAPINVTLELGLAAVSSEGSTSVDASSPSGEQPPAAGQSGQRIRPVQFDYSLTNPSTRTVDLLPSAWIAYAYELDETSTTRRDFERGVSEAIAAGTITSKHALIRSGHIVAGGALVSDSGIKPDETLTGTYLVYLPAGRYDYIEVVVSVPTATKSEGLALEWQVDDFKLKPQIYHILPNGDRELFPEGAEGAAERRRRELQMTVGREMLSLW